MDYMDIDQCEIPDTPDRLAAQNINDNGCIKIESDSSASSHSGNVAVLDEGARNKLGGGSKTVLDNWHGRRPSFRHGKNTIFSNNSEGNGDFTSLLGTSSSSKNAHLFRRMVAENITSQENKYSLHAQRTEKGKALSASQSPTCGENAVVDLTKHGGPARVVHNLFSNGALEDRQTKEIRKGPISTNGFSFLGGIANSSTMAHNACKGKEKIDDTCERGSGLHHGKGTFGDSQPKAGRSMASSFYSIPSPRVSGQKRLERNGCISPHNVIKGKQAENHDNDSMDAHNDKGNLVSDCPLSPIRDSIAEDSNFLGGQKMITHHSPSEELGAKILDLSSRSSTILSEGAGRTRYTSGDAFRYFEGLGGWRSTHNLTKNTTLPTSDDGQNRSRKKDDPCFVNQKNVNKVVRRFNGNGNSRSIGNDRREDLSAVSFNHGSALTGDQAVSHRMSELVNISGHHAAASTHIKRQKQFSAERSYGESSTSASVDSEIMFLGSSGERLNSRQTGNQSGHGPGVLDPVIEIDEFSPEVRHIGSHNTDDSSNDDSNDRARQVEADEMLARELQEQLYNEAPEVEDEEIDAHTESALGEEILQNAHSSGSHPAFHPRGSLISSFYRRLQSRPPQNPSILRGANAQGPSRLTRLRSRFPSQLPRVSYGESSSLFPPNMDLDMRIHILEALEAFSDMGMAGNFLDVEREFNENDYEMLLALDENIHHHGGASPEQINSLPQLTVQGDNFEEVCAICLETPTSGDTIRHLPCLHKFHKDCIDPWLGRKSSCPICKSSIT
ncbi:E3 ubiquitin-protein like [Actinidia chinensis var. chinensis]|uniref:E3 ubiquitin-protein like n=1 Tax=Actinidia chinensis var. chinensis TaxID=1590841 RepID=A0A2R6PX72_ACTCC|nr:E3 ubiquitin-protein like [Actinidia chinensis var. chinensis]